MVLSAITATTDVENIMTGGLVKSISRMAIATAAGAMFAAAGYAADLGGDCCADLEERIAELEATSARTGNRRVSLAVSGHVNEAIVFWEVDGAAENNDTNTSFVSHNASRSRFRFDGEAIFTPDWSAGFLMEFGVRRNDSSAVDQDTPVASKGLDVRHEALYLKSKRFGTVWLGWTSAATDGITEICLGCGLGNGPDYSDDMGGLKAGGDVTFAQHGGASVAFAGEGDRRDVVRYISPTFIGFAFSASTGGDDYWDAALTYGREVKGIRLAFGVGYSQDTDGSAANSSVSGASCTNKNADGERDCRSLGLSGSLMHLPSGVYIASAFGMNEDGLANSGEDTNTGWHVTAGVNRKFSPLGKTNLWAMYTTNEREIGQDSSLDVYGVGVEQKIDAAAMDLYLWYKHMDAELGGNDNGTLDQIVLGSRIKF